MADLAKFPISDNEAESYTQAFEATLDVVGNLQTLDLKKVPPTHQVTGLENSWHNDEVDESLSFTQEEATSNANETHDGFIVVERVIHEN